MVILLRHDKELAFASLLHSSLENTTGSGDVSFIRPVQEEYHGIFEYSKILYAELIIV
jgi:hypothetical protein